MYNCRKAACLPISGRDALLMMQISFFDDPVRCAQMCNKLADELEQRIAGGVSVVPAGTKLTPSAMRCSSSSASLLHIWAQRTGSSKTA